MSYEYNASTGRLEISNPYRIDNLGLFLGGGFSVIAAISLLFLDRRALADPNGTDLKGVIIAITLLTAGLVSIAAGLTQLRYFFGHGRPRDLTDSWAAKDTAITAIAENLRQGTLRYAEPQGPIANLVHKIFDSLIFAPQRIRIAAEAQAVNTLLTVALLFGLLLTYVLYSSSAVHAWTALFFGVLVQSKLLRRFQTHRATYEKARSSIPFLVLIIVLPILLPPVLNELPLPNLGVYDISETVAASLLILLVAQSLFFLALTSQLGDHPAINMAMDQRTLNINSNPKKLFEELERVLHTRWTEGIPNRCYLHRGPPEKLDQNSGSFQGDLIEESQPLPQSSIAVGSAAELFKAPSTRWIAALTTLGALTQCAGATAALICGLTPSVKPTWPATLILATVLALTSAYCRLSARELWGRVTFQSALLWFEIAGTYEIADVRLGNKSSSGMTSSKRVINVESMTLRVWAAEIDTVVFEKDDERDWVGMRGRTDLVKFYADHLEEFARRLPSIVVPQSTTDLDRIAALGQIQKSLDVPCPEPPPARIDPVGALPHPEAVKSSTSTLAHCPNQACAAQALEGALFCSACGTRLQLAT